MEPVDRALQERYDNIFILFDRMEDRELAGKLKQVHETYKEYYFNLPASCQYHHVRKDGYLSHVYEVMDIAIRLYNLVVCELNRTVNFTYDDIILVTYVHDINKIYRYRLTNETWKLKKGQKYEAIPGSGNYNEAVLVVVMCARFGIMLNEKHIEAIDHHHGGFSNHLSSVYRYPGSMTSFSSLIHSADLFSQYMYGKD